MSPDNRFVMASFQTSFPDPREGPPRALRLWDATTGKALWTLTQADVKEPCFLFLPDGKKKQFLVTNNGTVELRELERGKLVRSLPDLGSPFSMRTSPDGRLAVFSCEGCYRVIDLAGLKQVSELKVAGAMRNVRLSSDGQFLSVSENARWYGDQPSLWDLSTGELLRAGGPLERWRGVTAFFPNDSRAVIVRHLAFSWVHTVVETPTEMDGPVFDGSFTDLLITADGGTIVGFYYPSGLITRLDARTGNKISSVQLMREAWSAPFCFSGDGSNIVTCNKAGGTTIWDTVQGKKIQEWCTTPENELYRMWWESEHGRQR
jgi:WD40 repeat protein